MPEHGSRPADTPTSVATHRPATPLRTHAHRHERVATTGSPSRSVASRSRHESSLLGCGLRLDDDCPDLAVIPPYITSARVPDRRRDPVEGSTRRDRWPA